MNVSRAHLYNGTSLNAEIISTGSESDDLLEEGGTLGETRTCAVPADAHGDRLDRVLVQLFPGFSRSYLQQLVAGGAVQKDGAVLHKAATRLKAGDQLSVFLKPTLQAQAFAPQSMPLDVVYEDADLLVINKPAGLVVHPAAGNWSGTLLNGLLAYHPGATQLPRAGIVHRLDKDTSGLMLVAKSRAAFDGLVRAIAAREVSRRYLALAHGHWTGDSVRQVDQPIGRDARNRLRMAVVSPGQGKTAQTTFTALDSNAQATAFLCRLHTGRTHQIRVHAAWMGHPLVADGLYGGHARWGLKRQALHAMRLDLEHPVSARPLGFEALPPEDLSDAMGFSGLHYNPGIFGES
ncbi:MAG: RluA family pseudouridine synthase [Hydrogenophaga sp.]|nr:RluA family pseudouridine synthase [Hydrogenophaga sp.]